REVRPWPSFQVVARQGVGPRSAETGAAGRPRDRVEFTQPLAGCGGPDMPAALNVHTIVSMPFEENTYVVWRPGSAEALVIDPGLEPDLILEFLQEQGLTVAAILNTHGHADHIGGNEALKAAYPAAPLVIGAREQHLLTDANANLSAPFGHPVVSP